MSLRPFTIRRDRNGLRPVYNLGNELGDCPLRCAFCGVRKSPQINADENIANFEHLHAEFRKTIRSPYHPVIYNQGNCTNPKEFSWRTLSHILKRFQGDPDVVYVSINSRESFASAHVLERLALLGLSYPVHFIFGVESFSPRANYLLGKNTAGELKRFSLKLASFNSRFVPARHSRGYTFGLDVNLVFLPELYLKRGESRCGNVDKVKSGWIDEFRCLLDVIDPAVPTEINLHPYYRVEALPYDNADLDLFMAILPELQQQLDLHASSAYAQPPHIFVGVEGTGYDSTAYIQELGQWQAVITKFNRTGRTEWAIPNTVSSSA